MDVDDILIAGKHQAFFRHVALAGAALPHADIGLDHAQRRRRQRGLDRIWQVIIQAGLDLADEFTEAQHHA